MQIGSCTFDELNPSCFSAFPPAVPRSSILRAPSDDDSDDSDDNGGAPMSLEEPDAAHAPTGTAVASYVPSPVPASACAGSAGGESGLPHVSTRLRNNAAAKAAATGSPPCCV